MQTRYVCCYFLSIPLLFNLGNVILIACRIVFLYFQWENLKRVLKICHSHSSNAPFQLCYVDALHPIPLIASLLG